MTEGAELDELLRAMAHPHRRAALQLVWAEERTAGELAESLGLAPASASEHLRVLRKCGLVTVRRHGTFRLYAAERDGVARLAALLAELFPLVIPDPADPSPDPTTLRSRS